MRNGCNFPGKKKKRMKWAKTRDTYGMLAGKEIWNESYWSETQLTRSTIQHFYT